jgi:hypothetical protein
MILSVAPAQLECVECRRGADLEARSWQGYLIDGDESDANTSSAARDEPCFG